MRWCNPPPPARPLGTSRLSTVANPRGWRRIEMIMQTANLERRKIGALEVSLTGLGCNNFGWRIDAAQSARVVDAALDSGINFFDTADFYDTGHSEEYLGRALGGRRREAVIATKFGMKLDEARPGGARPEYVRRAAE